MTELHYEQLGRGEPLLLIHGTGSSGTVWRPVLDALAVHRTLIVVDLPGHGSSPVLPTSIAPTPPNYAQAIANLLDRLGLEKVDVAGNSVGGWTALELAKLGRASSVVALAPAGLWLRNPLSARATLWLTHHAPTPPKVVFESALTRTLLLSRIYGRPWRVPPEEAIDAAVGMHGTRQFDEHLRETSRTRFTGGTDIAVPITVAYGSREHLIPRRARRRDELPAHTRWLTLSGCGHAPFWDDPELVVRTILEGARPTPADARVTTTPKRA